MARIWLDDVRPAPEGYIWCQSVNKAKFMIQAIEKRAALYHLPEDTIEVIDCDHDMGAFVKQGGDGIKLLDWLIDRGTFYPIRVHSMNAVGAQNMRNTIRRYWPIKDQ